MDFEHSVISIGARQPDDDPRPGFYHAYREAVLLHNGEGQGTPRKNTLKLRFNEEHTLGGDLKSTIQSLMSLAKDTRYLLWLYRTGSMERIKGEQRKPAGDCTCRAENSRLRARTCQNWDTASWAHPRAARYTPVSRRTARTGPLCRPTVQSQVRS